MIRGFVVEDHVYKAVLRIGNAEQADHLATWFGKRHWTVTSPFKTHAALCRINHVAQIGSELTVPRLGFTSSDLHRHRIELTIVPLNVGLHERFKLFGAGHFYYPILCKICPIRGYCGDAVHRIGRRLMLRIAAQRKSGCVIQLW
ncbi:hypothetical protein D3C85_1254860 [compost metagenome]